MAKTGRRLIVQVDGRRIPCVTIGGMAVALDRTVHTVRQWERCGLLPNAPLILPSDDPRAVRRLYPVALVQAVSDVAKREGFGRRRPSGQFRRQSELLYETWKSVMIALVGADDGVMHQPDEPLQ
jgi:hypothetical protein